MDILLGSGPRELVYHLENPIRQPWPDMCAIIEQSISFPSVGRLPFSAWLDKVSSAKNNSQDLIEFFQDHFLHMATGNLILDTAKAREVSDTLKSTGTVDQSAVTAYLGFWKRIDFLA